MITIIASWLALAIQILIIKILNVETWERDFYLIVGMYVMSKITDKSAPYSVLISMSGVVVYTLMFAVFPQNGDDFYFSTLLEIGLKVVIPLILLIADIVNLGSFYLESRRSE